MSGCLFYVLFCQRSNDEDLIALTGVDEAHSTRRENHDGGGRVDTRIVNEMELAAKSRGLAIAKD